ncbi:hypothetical protein C8R48DRAFT_574158, partial [Suillus tomentosus]
RLTKDWIAPIYSFFNPVPVIGHVNGRRFHAFSCCAKGCNQSIRRFLDKADAKSTSNMRKHAKKCWGRETVEIVDKAKNATVARESIIEPLHTTGSITAAFERKGKGKVTYSHRQHTKTESRAEISLMKTGRPECYIPSASTVSHDVKLVFARTRKRIARMLQNYEGNLNFATDAWTSPNHKAFVAVSVHFVQDGQPFSLILDVVEVAK